MSRGPEAPLCSPHEANANNSHLLMQQISEKNACIQLIYSDRLFPLCLHT